MKKALTNKGSGPQNRRSLWFWSAALGVGNEVDLR